MFWVMIMHVWQDDDKIRTNAFDFSYAYKENVTVLLLTDISYTPSHTPA